MSCTIDETRIVIKYSTISGQEPTIPLSDDHGDGTWIPTDLYIGELFMNSVDNKIWIRTDNGIMPIGATGGTTSFIGDYVHISGGTFSGPVYAPTFSASGITASYIISDLFEGNFNGTFTGDGSGLTGIVANWLGGTVSNPVWFENVTYLDNDTYLNGTIRTTNSCIEIDSSLCISGGVSASYFIGDGSGLTNIPLGTQSDTYTETAELSGNSIVFTRNDSVQYNVDLSTILATQSIGFINWNELSNTFDITLNSGEVISTTIDTFTGLTSLTTISAPTFYGGDFFGTFTGTFSGPIEGDIYTSSANLLGTEAIFTRTDGSTYSLDLSTFSGGGSGSVGPTGSTGATGSNGITPYMFIDYNSTGLTLATGSVTLPISTPLYIGWTTGTRLRIWNDATHYMEGVVTTAMTYPQSSNISVNIDYVVGTGYLSTWRVGIAGDLGSASIGSTQSLAQTLVYGNSTGGTDINLVGGDNIISDDGEKIITFEEPRILLENNKSISGIIENTTLEIKQSSATSQLVSKTTDTGTSEYTQGAVQTTEKTARITANDSLAYTEAYMSVDSGSGTVPVAETRNWVSDINGNVSYLIFNPGVMEIGGANTDGFKGLEYAGDYSTNYSLRTLVDKEYVDNAVSGSTLPLEQVLKNGNTTGTQSIYISSSASQITGYNGVNQHWYDATNPLLGDYFQIENGTGSSSSFIKMYDNVRGDIHLMNRNLYDTSGSDSIYTSIYMGSGNTQITSEERDYATNTFWSKTSQYIGGNGGSIETRDFLNDTSALLSTYTDMSGTDTSVLIQSYHNGGLNSGQIYVKQDKVTLRSENNGVSYTNVEMNYTDIIVSGTPSFAGIQYDRDYSSNYTSRSLVDKAYVLSVAGGGGGGTFSGGTISNATEFQSNVTFDADILDENGNTIDATNMINGMMLYIINNF